MMQVKQLLADFTAAVLAAQPDNVEVSTPCKIVKT
jgi:hypothetical protein